MRWMAFAAVLCVLNGFSVAPAAAQGESTASATPASAPAQQSIDDYKLGVADKIRVLVYDEPSLSGDFTVGSDGTVALPLIGNVQAVNVSVSQLQDTIKNELDNGYLKNARVSIQVETFRPFYVLGEVTKPGEYPYETGLTVLNAVATAQGFTYRADKQHALIKHSDGTQETSVRLTPDLLVQPGDTIRIKERYF